jgi:hypothetical protein
MTSLDFSRCRLVRLTDGALSGVKNHVKVGAAALLTHPYFALFDEMGAMKSAQVIIAAQMLFEQGVIDNVVVVAPASVRTGVWFDPELGELSRHLWDDLPSTVTEFHARVRSWTHGPEIAPAARRLQWIVTNYEFVRPVERLVARQKKDHRLLQLLPCCTAKTLLVLDESSAIKSAQSQQTKACLQLRQRCGRVVLLNGTPIANSPGDMFSQGNMMSKLILNCPSYTQFCARYALMKPVLGRGGRPLTSPRGFVIKAVESWSRIDDIQRRFAPYVLRRLKKDCLDLPAKLPPVMLTVPLTPAVWALYKEMRDELVVWLSTTHVSQAAQAMTKIMRLSQITSGFLGGIEEINLHPDTLVPMHAAPIQEVGFEKQTLFLAWLDERLIEDPTIKILVRSRFRPEIFRLSNALKDRGDVLTGLIVGGQKREERHAALMLLDPRTMPPGPVVVVMSVGAGALGLNLTGAHTMFTLSNDFSLHHRLQSDDRIHRPGQTAAVSYFDLVATGPQGQKTIDHRVLAALVAKHDLATMTTQGWLNALKEE